VIKDKSLDRMGYLRKTYEGLSGHGSSLPEESEA